MTTREKIVHRSHRQWVREPVVFDVGDASAAKDEYGLIPEGDWDQVYETDAAVQVLGANERRDQREDQTTRWVMIIEPPKYTTLSNDMRVAFRGIEGKIETVEAKYDRYGELDRIKVVVMEVGINE